MKYLVLHNFRSYGKRHIKGEVVDEAEVRSPRLRISEGKIVPAVSSSAEPDQQGVAAPVVQASATLGETNKAVGEVKAKVSLSFGKK